MGLDHALVERLDAAPRDQRAAFNFRHHKLTQSFDFGKSRKRCLPFINHYSLLGSAFNEQSLNSFY